MKVIHMRNTINVQLKIFTSINTYIYSTTYKHILSLSHKHTNVLHFLSHTHLHMHTLTNNANIPGKRDLSIMLLEPEVLQRRAPWYMRNSKIKLIVLNEWIEEDKMAAKKNVQICYEYI